MIVYEKMCNFAGAIWVAKDCCALSLGDNYMKL